MQKLRLRVHPNIITLASLLPILLAGYYFFEGKLVMGALLYFGYFLGDVIDGKWARLTGKTSQLGARLDYFVCVFGNMIMFSGLWYSQYYLKGNWIVGGCFILAHYVIVASLDIFIQQQDYKTFLPRVHSYYSPQEEGFGTFFIATLFNIVDVLFPILVMLQFASFILMFFRQKQRPNMKKRIKERLLKI